MCDALTSHERSPDSISSLDGSRGALEAGWVHTSHASKENCAPSGGNMSLFSPALWIMSQFQKLANKTLRNCCEFLSHCSYQPGTQTHTHTHTSCCGCVWLSPSWNVMVGAKPQSRLCGRRFQKVSDFYFVSSTNKNFFAVSISISFNGHVGLFTVEVCFFFLRDGRKAGRE